MIFSLMAVQSSVHAITLPITGMSYNLELNQQAFARGVSNDIVDVPAYDEAIVTSDLGSILQQLGKLSSDNQSLHYRLAGSVHPSRAQISLPFNYEGDVAPAQQK